MFFVLLWPLALLAFLAVWCAAKSAAPALAALKRLDPAVRAALVSVAAVAVAVAQKPGTNRLQNAGRQWRESAAGESLGPVGQARCGVAGAPSFPEEITNLVDCVRDQTLADDGDGHWTTRFNPWSVRGAETYLSVDVYPQDILDSEISWFCESGTVTFPHGSAGREVAVVAGGDDDVVVRADFAGCPEPKMRFTLKPVDMRTVTIYPCEVLDRNETPIITRAHVEQLLQGVNDIYRQVGLQFVSSEVITVVNKQWNKEGLSSRSVGAAIRNHMTNTGGVEVYFINGSGAAKEPLESANVYGVIVRKSSGYGVLAHEIGHACKLCDIYVEKDGIRLHDDDYVLKQEHMPLDWGNYRGVVDQGVIIEELLMNGKEVGNRWYAPGRDIPLGSIFGLGKDSASTNGFSAGLMNVGERGMLLNPPHSN